MARGAVQILEQRCKGCGLCIDVCPQQVLAVSPGRNGLGYHPVLFAAAAGACTGCALCALVCPDAVFTVFREPVQRGGAARTRAPAARCVD